MKRLFILLAITAFTLNACDESSADTDNNAAAAGMIELDLSTYEYNFPIGLLVPDSTKGSLSVTPQSWGAIEIMVGENFQISISEGEGETLDLTFQKTLIEGDDVKKLKQYIVDEPNIILYETEIPGLEPEYHFYAIITAGERKFVVEDLKGDSFSKKSVEKMLESARSIKVVNTKPEA